MTATPSTKTDHSDGVHKAIDRDVTLLLKGKSLKELETLRLQIMSKIEEGGGTIDVEYWEGLLKRLIIYRAKATLREIHAQLLDEYTKHQHEKRDALEKEINETLKENRQLLDETVPSSSSSSSSSSSTTSSQFLYQPRMALSEQEKVDSRPDEKEKETEESHQYTYEEYLEAIKKVEQEADEQRKKILVLEAEKLRLFASNHACTHAYIYIYILTN